MIWLVIFWFLVVQLNTFWSCWKYVSMTLCWLLWWSSICSCCRVLWCSSSSCWFLPALPGWMAGTHRSLFRGMSYIISYPTHLYFPSFLKLQQLFILSLMTWGFHSASSDVENVSVHIISLKEGGQKNIFHLENIVVRSFPPFRHWCLFDMRPQYVST